jgi:Zn-dependent alcohol dehydrogenase
MQNLCNLGAAMLTGARFDDAGSFRMSQGGNPVAQMGGISTFSEYTTVDVNSCVKIPADIPFTSACLTGCGVGTGWGAAVNSADVQVGDTVVVMGIGGVGINAVQGAVHAGALNVIAVDPVPFKREKAEEFGATHTLASMKEATDLALELTEGQGADAAIVTVGVVTGEHVGETFSAIRKGGTTVVTGVTSFAEFGVPISLAELTLAQKRLQGSLYGGCSPSADIPRQLALYRAGRLKLDELVTTTYTLDQVAQATGTCTRARTSAASSCSTDHKGRGAATASVQRDERDQGGAGSGYSLGCLRPHLFGRIERVWCAVGGEGLLDRSAE